MSSPNSYAPSRRFFITASTTVCCGLPLGKAAPLDSAAPQFKTPAKSAMLFLVCGGAARVDMWDMKPAAPMEYRGEFFPLATTTTGIRICEHLPPTAQQAHRFSLIRGTTDHGLATENNHAGYCYSLTGRTSDASCTLQGSDRRPQATHWPHMGCVAGSQRIKSGQLPTSLTLPHKPSKAHYMGPGQSARRIGLEHPPFSLSGSAESPPRSSSPPLALHADSAPGRTADRKATLKKLSLMRREIDRNEFVRNHTARMSNLLANSSLQGVQMRRGTDKHAAHHSNIPCGHADITKADCHAIGIRNMEAADAFGWPDNLLNGGKPPLELFS